MKLARAEAEYAALHADNDRMQAAAKAQPGLIAQQELDDTQSKDLCRRCAGGRGEGGARRGPGRRGGGAVRITSESRAIQSYTNVIAPLDGVIVWRYADTGALIQSGTGLQ